MNMPAASDCADKSHSLLELVQKCNSIVTSLDTYVQVRNHDLVHDALQAGDAKIRPGSSEIALPQHYAFLTVDGQRVGLLTPAVVEALISEPNFKLIGHDRVEFELPNSSFHGNGVCNLGLDDHAALRSSAIAKVAEQWRRRNAFPAIKAWRDELYPVYGKNGKVVFTVERAASGLLGVRTFGCHCTAYNLPETSTHPDPTNLKLWISRRAYNKPTFPGLLDNTAGGGLTFGQHPRECMLRECLEETGLLPDVVDPRLISTGAVSYLQCNEPFPSLGGCIGPETQYVFDLRLPADVHPQVYDHEVEGFCLFSYSQAIASLRSGQFKPNSAVVLIDFLVRHGYVTPENEKGYLAIVHGMHRPLELEFPGPHEYTSNAREPCL